MNPTGIEYATHTANWLAGCSHESPACAHCWAETVTARLSRMPNAPARYRDGVTANGRWTGRLSYDPGALPAFFDELAGARKPRRVFVGDMTDLFHPDAPPESLVDLAHQIRCCPHEWRHTLLLLTKRPERMAQWAAEHFHDGLPPWVWCGATVEDQERTARIDDLRRVPARVRFLSVEPMLSAIRADLAEISWCIAGSESGPSARPTDPDWFRSLRDQCLDAGVPFFLKQGPDEATGKLVSMPFLDGRQWAEIPEVDRA